MLSVDAVSRRKNSSTHRAATDKSGAEHQSARPELMSLNGWHKLSPGFDMSATSKEGELAF